VRVYSQGNEIDCQRDREKAAPVDDRAGETRRGEIADAQSRPQIRFGQPAR